MYAVSVGRATAQAFALTQAFAQERDAVGMASVVGMGVRVNICKLTREQVQERNPPRILSAVRASVGTLLVSLMSPSSQERTRRGLVGVGRAPAIA